jgi:hypothetical protein
MAPFVQMLFDAFLFHIHSSFLSWAGFPAWLSLPGLVSSFLGCSLLWSVGFHTGQVGIVNPLWLPFASSVVEDCPQTLVAISKTTSDHIVADPALGFRFLRALIQRQEGQLLEGKREAYRQQKKRTAAKPSAP